MKIAVASGKGGTGKTTVAVNLAYYLSLTKQAVTYVDCDVEEPNGHLFLTPKNTVRKASKVMVPIVDENKCNGCGECAKQCQFNAIVILLDKPLVFSELCHGCAVCALVCPTGAITEGEREIGYIETGRTKDGIGFVQGILNVGEPMAGPLIEQVKATSHENGHLQIIDAPPGTSCPVIKTINDTDIVVMVTEPTPFGLHDLAVAVSVAGSLGKPIGIVINREQGNFLPLENYLSENKLTVLMRLPEDIEIARHYSRAELILEALPGYHDYFKRLFDNLKKLPRGENT